MAQELDLGKTTSVNWSCKVILLKMIETLPFNEGFRPSHLLANSTPEDARSDTAFSDRVVSLALQQDHPPKSTLHYRSVCFGHNTTSCR